MATTQKQRLSPVLMIQKYMSEGDGVDSTCLLSTLANRVPSKQSGPFALGQDAEPSTAPVVDTTVTDIRVGTHHGIHAGIDTGMHVYTDKHPCRNPGTDADIDANADVGSHANTHIGTHHDIHTGSFNGTHTGIRSGMDVYMDITPDLWHPFTPGQGKVLLYLIEADGKANRKHISQLTGVPLDSVAKTLSLLERKGLITRSEQKYYEHRLRGFYYTIDRQMCSEFYERIRGTHIGIHHNTHTGSYNGIHAGIHNGIRAGMRVGNQPVSSSSKELKTTTESCAPGDLLRDPELAYWKAHGVNNRKVLQWAEEFEMELEQVISSLKYCRYEMVVLNYEEVKQIRKPVDWFYRVVQRSGLYPKPAGYKSITELRVEQMEQEAMEAKALRERQQRAEKLLEFQRIMSDPDSREFKDILSKASEFSREAGGTILAMELESIYMGTNVESVEALALK